MKKQRRQKAKNSINSMLKYSRIFAKEKTAPIYLIIPGFIGNYSEGFVGRLYAFLLEKGHSVQGVVFRGHEKDEKDLASLDEMVAHIKTQYLTLRKSYPERLVTILAHSQGCAVALKSATIFDKKTSLVLIAPAIYLSRIILSRITKEDLQAIESGASVNCKISREKFRTINLDWILSYRNFSLETVLPKIKQHCLIVRPKEDWIDRENVDSLCQKLPNAKYLELPGDHIFAEPEDVFSKLVTKIFS